MHGEKGNAYRIVVGKPERTIPLVRRHGRRWEDSVKIDLKRDMMDWY
jgi:hypothetical protein